MRLQALSSGAEEVREVTARMQVEHEHNGLCKTVHTVLRWEVLVKSISTRAWFSGREGPFYLWRSPLRM